MGDYKASIVYIKKAITLTLPETDDTTKNDKLHSRLAKCFLHLLDFSSAEDAVSSISDNHLRTELYEWVESMKILWLEAPDEPSFRKQVLDQIPRYKSWLYVDPPSPYGSLTD